MKLGEYRAAVASSAQDAAPTGRSVVRSVLTSKVKSPREESLVGVTARLLASGRGR